MSQLFPTLNPSLRGGGVDCTKLSDDNFSLQDLKDRTGDWQRIAAYSDWIEARIFEESQPGMQMFLRLTEHNIYKHYANNRIRISTLGK